MPKIYSVQTAFTQGYLSPYLRGRTDLEQYYNGVARLKNYQVMKQGGIRPIAGTSYIAPAASASSRLIPFVASDSLAFMVELSNLSMRIYIAGILVATLSTPYTTAQIPEVEYIQIGGSMVLVHTSAPPKILRRITNAQWTISDYPFSIFPNSEKGARVTANNLTLSALTGAVTATAASAIFAATDVGRQITAGTGILTITGYTSATQVSGTTTLDFDLLVNTTWTLTDSPQTGITPTSKELGSSTTLTLDAAGWRGGGGLAGYSDIGNYVALSNGLVRITSVTSSTVAVGTVVLAMTDLNKVYAGAWTVNAADFSATWGYPGAVTFFEGRLIFGGSTTYPNRIWLSATGATDNFALGVYDGDSYTYDIGDAFDQIMHFVVAKQLICLTYAGEYTVTSRNNGPITPTSTTIRRQSSWGSNRVRPVLVDNVLLFVHRAGKKIFALQFDYSIDGYQSHELTEFIPDMFEGTNAQIKSIAFAGEPIPTLYMISSYNQDGVAGDYLKTCTLEFSQNIRAWGFVDIGPVASIAGIPASGGDQIWVNRAIASGSVLEIFDQSLDLWGALTFTGARAAGSTITGLGHLDGSPVTIIFDGVSLSGQTTVAGVLTLPVAVISSITVGIFYTSECELLPVEDTVNGSGMGKLRRLSEWFVRLYNTQCLSINGNDIPIRRLDTVSLNLPVPLFTGIKRDIALGWTQQGATITLSRTIPLKQVILSVNRGLDAHD